MRRRREEGEEEWEDVEEGDEAEETDEEEDEESKAAVDRVLTKYAKAKVVDEATEGGGFDARHEASVNEKMDELLSGMFYWTSSPSLLTFGRLG